MNIISGCTIRAYDPSSSTKQPKNSYLPNLHFYPIGLGFENGQTTFTAKPGYKDETFLVKTLETLIEGGSKILTNFKNI